MWDVIYDKRHFAFLLILFLWLSYKYKKEEQASPFSYYYLTLLPPLWLIFEIHSSITSLYFKTLLTLPSDPRERFAENLIEYDQSVNELTVEFGFCFILFCIAAWAKSKPSAPQSRTSPQ